MSLDSLQADLAPLDLSDAPPAGFQLASKIGVPMAEVSVISGDGGAGKSTAAQELAAIQANIAALNAARWEAGLFVDWTDFWLKDRSAPEWLFEDVLARGRGHSIYAKHGTGKSLFALWISMELVKSGHVVIYADYEMGADDLFDRLSDMGHGPETDLQRLRYLLLPDLQPLNSAGGAQEFGAILDEVQAGWPDRHVVAVIDTIGRAVVGEENSNDTILGFYRHTGMELRRRGVTWVRLDHAGHEGTHARGGSAKGDDVDVVWQLSPTDNGIELHADKRRMSWVPEKVALSLVTDPVLRYVPVAQSWPTGTYEAAEALDRLGVPLGESSRSAQDLLKGAGKGRRKQVVLAALKYRQTLAKGPETPREPPREPPFVAEMGTTPGTTTQIPSPYGAEPPPEPVGTTPAEPVGTTGSPHRGPSVPAPVSDPDGVTALPADTARESARMVGVPHHGSGTSGTGGAEDADEQLVGIILGALRDGSMSPDTDPGGDSPEVRAAFVEALRLMRGAPDSLATAP